MINQTRSCTILSIAPRNPKHPLVRQFSLAMFDSGMVSNFTYSNETWSVIGDLLILNRDFP